MILKELPDRPLLRLSNSAARNLCWSTFVYIEDAEIFALFKPLEKSCVAISPNLVDVVGVPAEALRHR